MEIGQRLQDRVVLQVGELVTALDDGRFGLGRAIEREERGVVEGLLLGAER
jgi:hypothetical protein